MLFDQLSSTIRLYFFCAISIGLILLLILLVFLRKLVNKQVEEQVEKFANEARIPKILKNQIGVKIKWR